MQTESLYYYTDFNTFKLIMQNGTLRFKESTASNDKLDTIQLYNNLLEMAEQKLNEKGIKDAQHFFFDMLKHNGSKSTRFSLVACFTRKADSRMLWDAYTMHRKDRSAERYNGVCIEFNKNELLNAMEKTRRYFDIIKCQEIVYGFDNINEYIERIMEKFSDEVDKMSKEKNQEQTIVPPIPIPFTKKEAVLKKCIVIPTLRLVDKFDTAAPYFKHSFWREEEETRALLSMKIRSKHTELLKEYDDGSKYYDIPIVKKCIKQVILGPEFLEDDIKIINSINCAIPFDKLHTVPSEGTGIITNR